MHARWTDTDLVQAAREGNEQAFGKSNFANGVIATPTWIINGRVIRGARPIDHYRDIIDRLL